MRHSKKRPALMNGSCTFLYNIYICMCINFFIYPSFFFTFSDTVFHHVSSFETYLSIVIPQLTRFLCRINTYKYCVIGLVTMSVIVALFPTRQCYTYT